jgi:hypothetical protein
MRGRGLIAAGRVRCDPGDSLRRFARAGSLRGTMIALRRPVLRMPRDRHPGIQAIPRTSPSRRGKAIQLSPPSMLR